MKELKNVRVPGSDFAIAYNEEEERVIMVSRVGYSWLVHAQAASILSRYLGDREVQFSFSDGKIYGTLDTDFRERIARCDTKIAESNIGMIVACQHCDGTGKCSCPGCSVAASLACTNQQSVLCAGCKGAGRVWIGPQQLTIVKKGDE